jgi:hypothetical protein
MAASRKTTRARTAAKPRPAAQGARTPRAGAATAAGVEAALAALREEVAALRRELGETREARADPPVELLNRLRASADQLQSTASELPRADDFQPLADHLYAFAQIAPGLVSTLEATRAAVSPLEAAARHLGEVAETLVATHQEWSQSLLQLPRAEDYEPLAAPLREFARVSPVLAETLASVVKAVTPLPAMVEALLGTMRSAAPGAGSGNGAVLDAPLAAAIDRMASARTAIREGLATLPRDAAYAKAAGHLRELATVSPSISEFLAELPGIALPLGESIASLEQAARELEDAEAAARQALAGR